MTTYYSVATGNWTATSTWSLSSGGAPGVGPPGTGDTAIIEGGYTVTVNQAVTIRRIEVSGGGLYITADITFDDAASNYFKIYATSGTSVTTDSSVSATRIIKSASSSPTYYWLPLIYDTTSSRTVNIQNIRFENAAWFLGNDNDGCNCYFNFPTHSSWQGYLKTPTPIARDPRLEYNPVDGRDYGRTYQNGGDSGIIQVDGYFPWSKYLWYYRRMQNMVDAQLSIAFTSEYVHMPRGYVENIRWRPRDGSPYLHFTLTLVEDPL